MNNWKVYKHTSPSGKVYIGITHKKPAERFGKNGIGYKQNKHFWGAIQKYGWDNFKHEIVAAGLTVEQASETEKELIKKYNSTDPKHGYNIADGGYMCVSGQRVREAISERMKNLWKTKEYQETRKQISKATWEDPAYREKHSGKNSPVYGRKHSKEEREKISLARSGKQSWNKGAHWDDDMRQKISEGVKKTHPHLKWTEEQKKKGSLAKMGEKNPNYGKPMPEEIKRMLIERSSIGINQLKEGEVIGSYRSAAEAERLTGINSTNIRRACNGDRKTAGGYVWENVKVCE